MRFPCWRRKVIDKRIVTRSYLPGSKVYEVRLTPMTGPTPMMQPNMHEIQSLARAVLEAILIQR